MSTKLTFTYVLSAFMVTACGNNPGQPPNTFHVFGDSIAAADDCQNHNSYTEYVANTRGYKPDNQAVGGTYLSQDEQQGRILRTKIAPGDASDLNVCMNDALIYGDNYDNLVLYKALLVKVVQHLSEGGQPVLLNTCVHYLNDDYAIINARSPGYFQGSMSSTLAHNRVIKEVVDQFQALGFDVRFVNLFDSYDSQKYTGPDHLHPSCEGQKALADIILTVL